ARGRQGKAGLFLIMMPIPFSRPVGEADLPRGAGKPGSDNEARNSHAYADSNGGTLISDKPFSELVGCDIILPGEKIERIKPLTGLELK
ncbi:MAG: hypothetical protein WC717_06590, partial [Candidatus Micrarchaeia archaeon]